MLRILLLNLSEQTQQSLDALMRVGKAFIGLIPIMLILFVPCFIIGLIKVGFKNYCIKVGKRNGTQSDKET